MLEQEARVASKTEKRGTQEKVVYSLKPAKEGRTTFSDVKLPNGTTIRRVDESVHRRALTNVSRAAKEKAS